MLLMAIPGLAPFAAILTLSIEVVQVIKLAMDIHTVEEAIRKHAPEALPAMERLARATGMPTDHVGRAMFAPHTLTAHERDYWTNYMNQARNL
jgi:hypothetical protein